MKVTIDLKCTYDPNRTKNSLRFTMDGGDFTNSLGERLGSMCNVLPVGIQITSEATGKMYNIKPTEFFEAVIAAEKEEII